jgi:tetratricopeptide (TPR) repeat protein
MAILEMASALPADAEAQYRAGEVLVQQKQYAKAVAAHKSAVAADPTRGALYNALAYAQALAGEADAGIQSIEAYERLEPKNPNPIDSKAEIQFIAGRYKDAAISFESAFAADPAFLQGFTMRKAAEAYLLAGDAAAAQRVIDVWASKIPAGPARERLMAVWDHRTRKEAEAIARLQRLANPDAAAVSQLAIWLAWAGRRSEALQAAARLPGQAGQLVQFVAAPSADGGTWDLRAAKAFPAPQQSVFRRVTLIYALALDRKWADVARILAVDYPQMNPLASAQLLAIYRRALSETGQTAEASKLLKWAALPAAGSDGLFDCLVYSK